MTEDSNGLNQSLFTLQSVPHFDSKYIVEEEMQSFFNFEKSSGINLLHINARSMISNFDKINSLLTNINYGTLTAVAITETWLSHSSHDVYFIPGYNFIASSRSTGGGGGVGIFLHTSLNYFVRKELGRMHHYIECIFIEITQIGKKNIIIGCIYRPSNVQSNKDTDQFNLEFREILKAIDCYKNLTIFLAGDYNLDLLSHKKNPLIADFVNTLISFAYIPSITRPTRVTEHSKTLLDNIFVKSLNMHVQSVIIYNDISDHFPIAIHSINGLRSHDLPPVKQRNFENRSIDNFNMELANENIWNEINILCETQNDSTNAYNCFLRIYSLAFDKHFPETTVKKNHWKTPLSDWMTKGLLKSCNKRSKLFKKYKLSNTPSDRQKYVMYRNKLKTIIEKAKKNYYYNKFKNLEGDMRKTWNLLGNLVKNKPAKRIPDSFIVNGNLITDKIKIVNKFNDYFLNIGTELASKIPSTSVNIFKFLKRNSENFCSLYFTDAQEIKHIVSKLPSKMSFGYDNIPISIVKYSIAHIAEPLAKIINCSITTGTFPDKLKVAKVCPIYKNGDKNCFENYRSISILPSFSKIFEKIVYIRLVKFLDLKKIIPDNQYGFRKGISSAMAITEMCNKITAATDRNEYSIGVFIDLSKAFDTINHKILLQKLEHHGVRGRVLDWFKNYLTNRKQYVFANGTSSNICDISCGVPQGSILGPLLFLLYISDIENCSDILSFILFADDTNLFYSSKTLTDLFNVVNSELSKLSEWFCVNKLSLNIKKTNYIIFGNRPIPQNDAHLQLSLNDTIITQVFDTKFLGVYLDNKLTWKVHISHLKLKLSRGVGIMRRVQHIVPRKSLLMLYHTLIYPYLVYCCICWGAANKSILNGLFVLQKQAIRVCSDSHYLSSSSTLFFNLKLLKLVDIVNFQTAIFMYKTKYKLLPECCLHYATLNNPERLHNTRNFSYFVRIYSRTNVRANSLSVRGPQLWDNLPRHIQDTECLGSFKRQLTQHYFSGYRNIL